MSLAVWLPLNGDLHNQGLSNIQSINNGATIDTNGKIGKCYNVNNSMGIIVNNSITLGTTFSITCWIKINSYNQNWANAFKIYKDGYDYIGLCMNQANATTKQLGFHIYKNNGSNARTGVTDNYYIPLTVGKWYHLCFIVTPTQVITYQDGVKIKTNNITTNFPSITNYNLSLGKSSLSSGLDCSINDFRLYDHALSAKEVEEISKGLVLHYKLDNIKTSIWSLNYYKRTATLTTSNTYIYSLPSKTIYLTPGKQYTIGAQVRVNQDNIKFNFDTNCTDENGVYTGNDAAQTVQYNPTITLEKDTWTQVWATTTIKSDAGKPYYHHGFLFKTTSGELSTICEIQNIEIYEGSAQVFTTYNNNNIIYDSSGYNNNGTIVGSLETITPSPRYSCAIHHLDSCADYIYTDALTFLGNSGFTFACWAQCNNYTRTSNGTASTGTQFIVSQGRDYRETSDKSYGASIVMQNGIPIWFCGNGTISSNIQISLNTWCHIVGTYDGTTKKIYVNGVLKNSATDNNVNWNNNDGNKFVIGKMSHSATASANVYFPFVGNISDVRIYATALTEAQVKELYNTSMSVDSSGNIHARELVEL